MSPIAAMKVTAVCMLTPGTVMSRRTSGEARELSARATSILVIYSCGKSIWRRQPATVSGSLRTASQARPPTPKRSVAGERPSRQRESTAWTSFLALVRWRTRAARAGHPPAQRLGGRVGDPDRVEHARVQQAGERTGVEAVRLDPGMGDRPHLLGVGDDHPGDVGFEDPGDLHRRSGRLHHQPVIVADAFGEELQLRPAGLDPPGGPRLASFADRHLAEALVDVESDCAHGAASSRSTVGRRESGQTTTTDSRRGATGPAAGATN